jgi:SAM-dependent methyltransferase
LEHVTDPKAVFNELSRLLKPGGKLYLTTNFLFPIHGAPFDFYRFTHFGLNLLAKESSFSEVQISARGGFFSLCAKLIFDFPAIIKSWLFYGNANPHGQRELSLKNPMLITFIMPSVFMLDIFCTLIAALVSLMDPLDKRRRFTLGYQLTATRV